MTTTESASFKTVFKVSDKKGNVYRLIIVDKKVRLVNQHGIPLSLSNVMFLSDEKGLERQQTVLRKAALSSKDKNQLLKEICKVTKLKWSLVEEQ